MATNPSIVTLFDNSPKEKVIPIDERRTDELVIGMIGPVGSGVSFTADIIADVLKDQFKYAATSRILKVSKMIEANAGKVGLSADFSNIPNRIKKLQEAGTALRKKFGASYLADKCIQEINLSRGSPVGPAMPRRYFTIIDSIKNTQEIHRLRAVYGENFWLFGVFAPESVRRNRFKKLNNNSLNIDEIFRSDESEGTIHGQMVRDAMQMSDFFVRNDGENDERTRETIKRFLNIIFGTAVVTPTIAETSMFAAVSAAAGSACLSRQVGAVIATDEGDIIGRGTNDVPKFGGGLYAEHNGAGDHRCYKWQGKICHNDSRKQQILNQAVQNLIEDKVVTKNKERAAQKAIQNTGLKNLIEFSRSIHAEMEAIISVARSGKSGLVGSTLYSTTFPCHSCARHIVASGIKAVIYIEPYAKSLAMELHDDAITMTTASEDKVQFLQYEGVSPRNAVRLFKDRGDRKNNGKLSLPILSNAHPATHGMLDGFSDREQIVVITLSDMESGV